MTSKTYNDDYRNILPKYKDNQFDWAARPRKKVGAIQNTIQNTL